MVSTDAGSIAGVAALVVVVVAVVVGASSGNSGRSNSAIRERVVKWKLSDNEMG